MILVFGKTGQVANELKDMKDVISIDRLEADLNDPRACEAIIGKYKPTAVINAAAYTDVDNAENEEEKATVINGYTPGAIARKCANINIPFVHISSEYVFDGCGKIPVSPKTPPNPQNAYGRSKLQGEKEIITSNANYAIVRTSRVVSAHGKNFVKTMLQLSQTKENISVVSDQIGGPTPAKALADACREIASQIIIDPKKSGIYHFSGSPNVSWCQFANEIFKKINCTTKAFPVLTSQYPTLAKRPRNNRLDCRTTKSIFNISRPNWKKSLDNILNELEAENGKT